MRTKWWSILLMVLCTFLTATGQLFWKISTKNLEFSILSLITNYALILGFVLYALAAVLFVIALKYGDLSVLYPIIATSFIWVSLISLFFFNEALGFLKIFGVISILGGISLIGKGSRK